MKKKLLCAPLCLFIYLVNAQTPARQINFRSVGKDSINLPMNEEYNLIEDSCAQIIRHSHFSFKERKFFGKFTDVSKSNPKFIVSEGNYSDNGLKEGDFVTHYLNGNLEAKGGFRNNKYDGKWEMYYENGKPELTFEAVEGDITITDAWNAEGKKIVDNGNGNFVNNMGRVYWRGKLVNGKPDGNWRLIRTDDISETPITTERFKKGQFRDGSAGPNDYTTGSRLTLVSPFKLPFVNAEGMHVSSVPCNGVKSKHVVNAQYINGLNSFSIYIGDAVSPYLGRVNLTGIDNTIEINGEISENGSLVNLKNNGSVREDIARGIIMQLRNLPLLHPATVDGKAVRQKFVISFKIYDGLYSFSYRFLPIQVN